MAKKKAKKKATKKKGPKKKAPKKKAPKKKAPKKKAPKKKVAKKKAARKKTGKKKSPKTKTIKKKAAKKPPGEDTKGTPREERPDTALRHPKLIEPPIPVVGAPTPETAQTPEHRRPGGEQKQSGRKSMSRKRVIGLAGIGGAFVVVIALFALEYTADLLRPPFAVERPYDFKAARSNLLELQALALSEAKAGRPSFFYSHIGCAAPPVWQDHDVLQNFKRMVDQGVEVKLIVGQAGTRGEPRAGDWPQQFADELGKHGLEDVRYCLLPKALPNHSVVAGSSQYSLAYICLRQADDIYPTEYIRVQNRRVCKEWKKYLLSEFLAVHGPSSRPR